MVGTDSFVLQTTEGLSWAESGHLAVMPEGKEQATEGPLPQCRF